MRSDDGHVKTKNGMVYLNNSYMPIDNIKIMKEEAEKTYPSNIEGLEDVRLFMHDRKVYFTASAKNLTEDGKIMIAIGAYNTEESKMNNISVIQPPRPSDCEKNWIYVPNSALSDVKEAGGKMNFIYGWHPLEIGTVNEDKKLEIHTKYDTPSFFSRFRGSSTLCEFGGKLWCVVHFVKYSTPRVYYHSVVCFNKDTMKLEKYSLPFAFKKLAIEYCLGFNICNGDACFVFSQNDTDPGMINMPLNNLRFLTV